MRRLGVFSDSTVVYTGTTDANRYDSEVLGGLSIKDIVHDDSSVIATSSALLYSPDDSNDVIKKPPL